MNLTITETNTTVNSESTTSSYDESSNISSSCGRETEFDEDGLCDPTVPGAGSSGTIEGDQGFK